MRPWRFVVYWPMAGHNPIRVWESLPQINVHVRAAMGAALDALAQTDDWLERDDLYQELEHDDRGLGEIKFHTDEKPKGGKKRRRRFRAFVKRREEHHDCILLTCCEHWPRHRPYDPPDAPKTALKYLKAFEAGQGFIDEHI